SRRPIKSMVPLPISSPNRFTFPINTCHGNDYRQAESPLFPERLHHQSSGVAKVFLPTNGEPLTHSIKCHAVSRIGLRSACVAPQNLLMWRAKGQHSCPL